ncbi:PHP domain-containing protein [Sanguibacter gelidistatuariae]|uniref:PHP domain-containing protein n=1 Tax=Sanguibacter gelidistatuariae TaxID=1814289 RepID=UPI000B088DE7|nr:PHP domain-containing protein [Sanguibacter gelidistatuariae]
MPRDPVIDLHTHSNASDGTESPAALVAAAAEAGLDVVALTDHDTTAGWAEAAGAARRFGVALVPGTEFSARARGVSVHLLSYLHDPAHEALVLQNAEVQAARTERARRMVGRLAVDYAITWEDVLAHTEPGTTIGRPHIADALVALGYLPDRSAAFSSILRPGTPYYVPHFAPDGLEVIRAVRDAGGVPVFAHPGADGRGRVVPDEVIEEMAAAGLVGLEVYHRDNSQAQQVRLTEIARSLGLLMTGSSDYHGTGKPNRLAENTTHPEVFARIEELGRSEVIRQ